MNTAVRQPLLLPDREVGVSQWTPGRAVTTHENASAALFHLPQQHRELLTDAPRKPEICESRAGSEPQRARAHTTAEQLPELSVRPSAPPNALTFPDSTTPPTSG